MASSPFLVLLAGLLYTVLLSCTTAPAHAQTTFAFNQLPTFNATTTTACTAHWPPT